MAFRLPEYDQPLHEFVHATVNQLAHAQSALLSGVAIDEAASPISSVIDRRDGEQVDLPATPIGFEMTLEAAAVRDGRTEILVGQISAASDLVERQLGEMLVATSRYQQRCATVTTGGRSRQSHPRTHSSRFWRAGRARFRRLPF